MAQTSHVIARHAGGEGNPTVKRHHTTLITLQVVTGSYRQLQVVTPL